MITDHQSSFSLGNLRRSAFYAVTVGALAIYAVLLRDLLPMVLTAWYVDVGPHRFHDLNFLALVWVGILGLAVQLYRPDERVTAAVASVLVMGPLALLAATSGSPIAMLPAVFTVVGLVVVALHPAGRSMLEVRRVEPVDRSLVALLVVAALPLLSYAADQVGRQYAVADDHAALVHYGGMAVVAGFVLLMGVLATARRRDRRFAAWAAGALAVYLGASSVAFPGLESSAGPVWGGLAVAWGAVFVAAVELNRRRARTGAPGG